MRLVAFLFLIAACIGCSFAAWDNSLSDCLAFAAKFNNTCGSLTTPVSDITTTTGIPITCTSGLAQTSYCPGTLSGSTCTFFHKLCVTCQTQSGVTRIRVQSNNLPNRCMRVGNNNGPVQQNIDFTVNFNPAVTRQTVTFTSQAGLTSKLCSNGQYNLPPTTSNLVTAGSFMGYNGLAAVMLDGMANFQAVDSRQYDPYYPPTGGSERSDIDDCLSHATPTNVEHYHSGSVCPVTNPSGNQAGCANTPACFNDVKAYMLSMFNNHRTLTVLGIATDGHPLYGPYLSDGSQPTCLDACNGMFLNGFENYAYFVTNTFPYHIGCVGPSNYPAFAVSSTCTTNPTTSYNTSCPALPAAASAASTATVSWVALLIAVLASALLLA